MSILLALFLGLVQGLTEFLPVSSSGHLILAQHLLNMPEDLLLFNILLHIATLLAVMIVFYKRIWNLVRHPIQPTNLYLIIATAITVGFVLLFNDLIEGTFTPRVLPITFLITATLLYSTTFFGDKSTPDIPAPFKVKKPLTLTTAVAAGLAQSIAVIPGFSRSGFTITAALATGTKRERAAEFSFLMSIPIIIAALVYELISNPAPTIPSAGPMIIAFLAALVSGIFAIRFMLHIVKKIKLGWFSLYLVILSIVTMFILW